jgi:hypothetical protein
MKCTVHSIEVKICLIISLSKNGLKQGDTLLPLLFNFALEYANIKVQKKQVGLKLNRKHHSLPYADDVNLLEDNTDTIKKNKRTVNEASMEVGLLTNIKKTSVHVADSSPECIPK